MLTLLLASLLLGLAGSVEAGWYLLAPEMRIVQGGLAVGDGEPLNRWEQINAYETAAECESFRLKLRERIQREHGDRKDTISLTMRAKGDFMRCISSDDVRLKEPSK